MLWNLDTSVENSRKRRGKQLDSSTSRVTKDMGEENWAGKHLDQVSSTAAMGNKISAWYTYSNNRYSQTEV